MNFISFFLALPGLHCCLQAFSSWGEWKLLSSCDVQACHYHSFSLYRAWTLGAWASVVATQRRQWHRTPVLSPGKSHAWRSLVVYIPWGLKESDTTERLHFHFSFSHIGEGDGNPLQCSCLENPRDRGAWWAAIYGVTQSRTRLKQLSSSNSSGPLEMCCLISTYF